MTTPEERRERANEASRRWRARNREQRAAIARRYAAEHPETIEHSWRSWRARNPEKYAEGLRRWNLRTRYGITLEEYDALLTAQGGRCAICGTDSPGRRVKFFAVDHDHRTGAVRGLLCQLCNQALGQWRDAPAILRRAIAYLEKETP